MPRDSTGRRRGVSLALNERVFRANRSIRVPSCNVKTDSEALVLPVQSEVKVQFDLTDVQDSWEPSWARFDHIDAAIERSIHVSSQPYVSLLSAALDEIAKLEKQRAAKELEKQKEAEAKALQEQRERMAAQKERESAWLARENEKVAASPQAFTAPDNSTPFSGSSEKKPEALSAVIPNEQGLETSAETAMMEENVTMSIAEEPRDYVPHNVYTQQIDSYDAEYARLRFEYEAFVQDSNPEVKKIRLDIAKRINTTVNTLASTQKQVNNSYTTLVNIRNEYSDMPQAVLFMTFRVVEAVLDCCEPGCQMYLNPKAVWPSAHLLRGLMALHPSFRVIYFSMAKKRCPYAVPRLYHGADDGELERQHNYSKHNKNTYFKKQTALVRLHMALLAVTKDAEGIWAWFSGFVNACSKPVFKLPLAGVLVTSLSVAAYFCLDAYREQFKKVLTQCDEMVGKGHFKVANCEAAEMHHEQLSHFFKEYKRSNRLTVPEGFELKEQEEELHRDV